MKEKISKILIRISRVMAAAGVAQEGDFDTARELLSGIDEREQNYTHQQDDKSGSMGPLRYYI